MRKLVVAPGHGPHARADLLADLQRRERDAAADAPDQHVFAGLHARARHDHAPRRERRERERGGRSGGSSDGIVRTFAAGTTTYSASVPGRCSPSKREARTERLLAGATVLARTVAQPGVDDDVVADATTGRPSLPTASITPHASAPNDHGGMMVTPGKPPIDEQIEMVERGGANAHADVVGPPELAAPADRRDSSSCSSPP